MSKTKDSEAKEAAVRSFYTHTFSNGKKVRLGQLGLQDYKECKDQALKEFKREMIKTWTENADLLPGEDRHDLIKDAFKRAEAMTAEDLPGKVVMFPEIGDDGKVVKVDGRISTKPKRVPYESWWISETTEGQLFAVMLSMKHGGQKDATLETADELFIDCQNKDGELEELAQAIGELSESKLAKN